MAWALAAILPLLLAAPSLASDYDRWYVVKIGGEHAGWLALSRKTEGDRITTHNEMTLRVARGTSKTEIRTQGEFVESRDGTPIALSSLQRTGATPITTRGTFAPTSEGFRLDLESTQSGVVTRRSRDFPRVARGGSHGTWLTPAAAEDYVRARLLAHASTISVSTIDAGNGAELETIARRNIEPATLTLGERTIDAFRCESLAGSPDATSIEFLDGDGVPLKFEAYVGGLHLEFEESTRALAQRADAPPEIMVSMFVRPDRAIRRARGIRSASYLLRVPGEAMPDVVATGSQSVERMQDGGLRVRISMKNPTPASTKDVDDPAFRRASAMINCDDARVRELADRALKKSPRAPEAQAERLRDFVGAFITRKDLDTAMASASEVARTHSGDCTEHAVLLAALLRTQGIPSRVVSGLLYADRFAGAQHIFAYHMWTQALLRVNGKPTWVDLDATLPAEGAGFDATHIAILTTSMSDDAANASMSALLPLLGRLTIGVEHAE
jgi:hypothetical protein